MSASDPSRHSEAEADRWKRVEALFHRALALPEAERQAIIRASEEPSDVQDEVLELLQSHDETSEAFLEPPALLRPGAQVGSYRIEGILGQGGMGVVYRVHDTKLNRPVALKALPPHLYRDGYMRGRLRQEALAAAALSHPGIATIYAFEEIGDQIFIASELLEGRRLREEMAAGPLPVPRALDIARTIGSALHAAHERGIVHRDLKPENVIFSSSGTAKIVDFGIAKINAPGLAIMPHTITGQVVGTVPYMAPEQLLGKPTSGATDQFAFGVVLYEMLTGRHPFGTIGPQMMARIIVTEADYPADLDDELWRIIGRTLEKEPEKRFPSMQHLLDALGGLATPSGRSIAPQPFAPHLGWWRTHQLAVALGYYFMVYPAWAVHKWTGRYGVLTFLATVAIVVVGANVRLTFWFTAGKYPRQLREQLASWRHLVRAADVAFSLIMIATGLVIADDHTGWGALFVAFGLGAALAFLVIEPTTARDAFSHQQSGIGNLK